MCVEPEPDREHIALTAGTQQRNPERMAGEARGAMQTQAQPRSPEPDLPAQDWHRTL